MDGAGESVAHASRTIVRPLSAVVALEPADDTDCVDWNVIASVVVVVVDS